MGEQRDRTEDELKKMLVEQMHLLVKFCALFDAGDLTFAKPISTCLRTLLHMPDKPKPRQGSLLAQLGLRGGGWVDVRREVGRSIGAGQSLFPELLAAVLPPKAKAYIVPRMFEPEISLERISFDHWWTAEIIHSQKFVSLSRRDIVKAMADKEGGSHVDGTTQLVYEAFSNGKYAQVEVAGRPVAVAPELCIRTIAHETLLSVQDIAPWSIATPYTWVPITQGALEGTVFHCGAILLDPDPRQLEIEAWNAAVNQRKAEKLARRGIG